MAARIRYEHRLGVPQARPFGGIPRWAPFLMGILIAAAGCRGPAAGDRTETGGLPPLYTVASNPEGTSYGYGFFFNAFRVDHTPREHYTHLVPFYFHREGPEDEALSLVLPLYYHRRRSLWEDRFLLLLGERRRGARKDFFPLFPLVRLTRYEGTRDRSGMYAFPFLQATRDGPRRHWTFFDLLGLFRFLDLEWGIPRMDGTRGMNFSFADALGLLRLASGRNAGGWEDFECLTLLSSEPLSLFQRHWRRDGGRRGHTVFFPFYWHFKDPEGESIHLWPLAGRHRGKDGTVAWHVLYPLVRYERNRAHGRWAFGCPWPLFYLMRGREGIRENRFLPLFWDARWEHAWFFMLAPFYAAYGDDRGATRRFYTPFFSVFEDRARGACGFDLLYPLASHVRSAGEVHDRFLPFFYATRRGKERCLAVTPLFWSLRGEEGEALDMLFPLYARFGWGEDDRTYSILPLFKLLADRPAREWPGRFQADLLWPLAGYGTRPGRTIAWFFPLFKHVNDRDGQAVEWSFAAGIFDLTVVKSRKTFTFLWFIPFSWGGEGSTGSEESKP